MARLKYLTAAFLVAGLFGMTAPEASADPEFEGFIRSMWPKAKAAGISRDLFDRAFAGISDPDPEVLKLAKIGRAHV